MDLFVVLAVIVLYGAGAFLLWWVLYLAVKHGVLNAMRQLEQERGDGAGS